MKFDVILKTSQVVMLAMLKAPFCHGQLCNRCAASIAASMQGGR
jgi:hypothetical protein